MTSNDRRPLICRGFSSLFARSIFGLIHRRVALACPGRDVYIPPSCRTGSPDIGLLSRTQCYRPDGEIGRHTGLKIRRPKGCAGSTPARGTIQIRRLRRFPKRLSRFKIAAIMKCCRTSLCLCDLFASPSANVMLGHGDSCVSQLLLRLQDIPATLCLVGACLGAQIPHLKLGLWNLCRLRCMTKPLPEYRSRHRSTLYAGSSVGICEI